MITGDGVGMRQAVDQSTTVNILSTIQCIQYTVYSIQYAVYSALTFLFRPAGDSEGVGDQAGLHLQD